MVRRFLFACAILLAFQGGQLRAQEQKFDAFKADLWRDAQAKGVTRANFDLALKGVTPDQRVINATQRQPEYGKPVGDYVNAIVSNRRIADGQLKAREWAKTFDAVEQKFQVERWVLLALWGMESDFGTEKDRWDVFRSLATLAYVKYREPYFRNELLVAMGRRRKSAFTCRARHGLEKLPGSAIAFFCESRKPNQMTASAIAAALLRSSITPSIVCSVYSARSRTAAGGLSRSTKRWLARNLPFRTAQPPAPRTAI